MLVKPILIKDDYSVSRWRNKETVAILAFIWCIIIYYKPETRIRITVSRHSEGDCYIADGRISRAPNFCLVARIGVADSKLFIYLVRPKDLNLAIRNCNVVIKVSHR